MTTWLPALQQVADLVPGKREVPIEWFGALAEAGTYPPVRLCSDLRLHSIWKLTEVLPRIMASPDLDSIEHLTSDQRQLGTSGARALSRASWRSLRGMALENANLGAPAGKELAKASFPELRTLNLSRNPLTDKGLAPLLASMPWPRLEVWSLAGCRLGDDSARKMAATNLPLSWLDLSYNKLSTTGVQAVVASQTLTDLVEVRFGGAMLTGQDAGVLLDRIALPRLERLSLDGCKLWAKEITSLREGAVCSTLRSLCLGRNPLGADGIAALADWKQLETLESLDLFSCKVDSKACEALAASPNLGRLRRLDLDGNPITQRGAEALASSTMLNGLEELTLRSCHVPLDGLRGLLAPGALPSLRKLSADMPSKSPADQEELQQLARARGVALTLS
jgi:Leucine-rich repeat (LRR) protein